MTVRKGYKLTEIGEIPEDWEVLPLKSIGMITSGNTFPLHYQGKISGEIPFFKVSDMNIYGNSIYMNRCSNYISHQDSVKLNVYLFNINSIIFAKIGAAIFLERRKILVRPSCLDNNLAALGVNDKKAFYKFIYYILCNIKFSNFVSTTALPSLNNNILYDIKIALPPKIEQAAIASALSDMDSLIISLERLIAKKSLIKQGAMRELLTGKKRLPGFDGEWKESYLGDVSIFLSHANYSYSDLNSSGKVGYLHYGFIHSSKYQKLNITELPRISKDQVKNYDYLKDGDIIVADVSEDEAGIGKYVSVYNCEQHPAISGLHTIVIRPDQKFINYAFSPYLLSQSNIHVTLCANAVGTKVYSISKDNIASLKIKIPSLDEQAAIASVLSDMDNEIAALEAKLAKTRQLKSGMMEELLTGRIRLA